MSLKWKFYSLLLFCILTSTAISENQKFANKAIQETLNKFCLDCHNQKKQKGDIRLDNFLNLNPDIQMDLVNKIEEQVYLEQMPPEDEELFTKEVKKSFLGNIQFWNESHQLKSAFKGKLKTPEFGNYLDHEKLFSGEHKQLKGFTYNREWLLSEHIFKNKINSIIYSGYNKNIDGKNRPLVGANLPSKIINPFLLNGKSGIFYYDNELLNSGHFITMLDNSKHIAAIMINNLSRKNPEYLPVLNSMAKMKNDHKALLEKRKIFIQNFIDKLCADIYEAKNTVLLPKYRKIVIKESEINPKASSFGKWGWRNRIGNTDTKELQFTIRKFQVYAKSKAEIIEKCVEYWTHWGTSETVIQRRVAIMKKELSSILRHAHFKKVATPKYKPLSKSEMDIMIASIKKHRIKGMPYKTIIEKCLKQWNNNLTAVRKKSHSLNKSFISSLLNQLYEKIYQREPTPDEMAAQSALIRQYGATVGLDKAIEKLVQTLLLRVEFLARDEYGTGKADQYGRRLLSPRNAAYAISYALTENLPDMQLVDAAKNGRLNTKADYRREIERILKDRSTYYIIDNVVDSTSGVESFTNMPVRKIRFFRDFFGYPSMMKIFKDTKRFGGNYTSAEKRLVSEADMLVAHILDKDKNVFQELLTTDKFYVYHNGDNEKMSKAADGLYNKYKKDHKKVYDYFTKHNWKNIKTFKELDKHKSFFSKVNIFDFKLVGRTRGGDYTKKTLKKFHIVMTQMENGTYLKTKPIPEFEARLRTGRGRSKSSMRPGVEVTKYFDVSPNNWDYSGVQPAKVPNRKGILSHPAWLAAFSQNTQTDPVIRGKWIKYKLLAGTVPDIPINVDAVVPEDHTKTLRQRLDKVTGAKECWKCHKYMNPLGIPFEIYDDFGRFRTDEELEYPQHVLNQSDEMKVKPIKRHLFRLRYKTLPVNAESTIKYTGDSRIDGKVNHALELIDKLAESERVRQSIIRHAFRFFLGRNETLYDSKTLIDADQAYVKSGGSFDALIISLLTSDSFIYRKAIEE